jgi:hypothetical protein
MEKSVLYAGASRKPLIRKFAIKNGTFLDIICGSLILLFMYAAVSKLMEYGTFKLQLSQSPYITRFADVIVWALPAGEIILCILLAFSSTRLIGLYGSLFLMTLFTAYIYSMLFYSYYIPCSCGGILSKMSWVTHFWFNIGFTILTIAGIFLCAKKSIKKIKEEPPPVIFT